MKKTAIKDYYESCKNRKEFIKLETKNCILSCKEGDFQFYFKVGERFDYVNVEFYVGSEIDDFIEFLRQNLKEPNHE